MSRFVRHFVFVALLTGAGPALAAPAGSQPATPAVDTARLKLDLAAYHRIPSGAVLIKRHGPGVADALRQIALQGGRPLARNRALTVLRHFPSRATQQLLAQLVDRYRFQRRLAGLAVLDLKQAIVSYAVVAGKRALPRARALLSHGNLDVRCAAAEAVRRTKSPRAKALLTARLEIEPSSTVRAEIRAELAVMLARR